MFFNRFHRDRDLLRRCNQGQADATDEFNNIYQGIIATTVRGILENTEATEQDIADVITICRANIFAACEKVPSRMHHLNERVEECGVHAACAFLKTRRQPPPSTPELDGGTIPPPKDSRVSSEEVIAAIGDTARIVTALRARYRLPIPVAEDIIHDTILQLLQRLDDLPEDRRHLQHFVRAAIFNRAIDEMRTTARRQRLLDQPLWTAIQPSPETALITGEKSARLQSYVARLREPYRTIFELQLTDQLSLAEVARRTNTNLDTIYTQHKRGLALLRQMATKDETS